MFELRQEFMEQLRANDPKSYPPWPVDVAVRENQQALRETTLRGVEELFEALQHLKNWKTHRADTNENFDREAFLEEMVDAVNYFFAVLILLGIDEREFYDSYIRKHQIIMERLENKTKS
jgi:hypothetical protein